MAGLETYDLLTYQNLPAIKLRREIDYLTEHSPTQQNINNCFKTMVAERRKQNFKHPGGTTTEMKGTLWSFSANSATRSSVRYDSIHSYMSREMSRTMAARAYGVHKHLLPRLQQTCCRAAFLPVSFRPVQPGLEAKDITAKFCNVWPFLKQP